VLLRDVQRRAASARAAGGAVVARRDALAQLLRLLAVISHFLALATRHAQEPQGTTGSGIRHHLPRRLPDRQVLFLTHWTPFVYPAQV